MHDNLFDDDTLRDAYLMGIDPHLPFYDLNLAGAQGIPDISTIASAVQPATANAPTFTAPDSSVPQLAPYDLIGPGIDLQSSQATDPLLPDLSEYARPYGLDFPQDTALPQALAQIDPLLPDLQHPDLTAQTQMPDRPGDLASDAIDAMHLDLTYQQLDDKTYPAVFLDQAGDNSTRARHMDLLMRGLDEEEH
jgi:hypothetical protein